MRRDHEVAAGEDLGLGLERLGVIDVHRVPDARDEEAFSVRRDDHRDVGAAPFEALLAQDDLPALHVDHRRVAEPGVAALPVRRERKTGEPHLRSHLVVAEGLFGQPDLQQAEEFHPLAGFHGPVHPEEAAGFDLVERVAAHPAVAGSERPVQFDPVRFLERFRVELHDLIVHQEHRGPVRAEVDVGTPVVGAAERDLVRDLSRFAIEDPDLRRRLVNEAVRLEVHHHRDQVDTPGARPRGRAHEADALAHRAQPEVVHDGHLGGVEHLHGLHPAGHDGEVPAVGGPVVVGGRPVAEVPDLLEGQGFLVEGDELVRPDAREEAIRVLSARRAGRERDEPQREHQRPDHGIELRKDCGTSGTAPHGKIRSISRQS